MRKSQTFLSILTLICSVCSLILSTLAFIRSEDTATMVDLQAQNTQLQSQIDKLTARMSGSTESATNPASSAYGNLIVDSFSVGEVELIIDSAYVQVQLPQTTADCVTIRRAELVLLLGDNELYQQDITLQPGEGEGGYDLTITGMKLPLPALDKDDLLELVLEVTLSDGQSFRSPSVSWYANGDELLLIAG